MSDRTEVFNARYVLVDGTAQPETMHYGDGESNQTSAIRFRTVSGDIAFVIEGRPEDVLTNLRLAVASAEENLKQTVRSPELRRMYGLQAEAEASQLGTADPVPSVEPMNRAWHQNGVRCPRANVDHDCPDSHRYGATFDEAF